MNALATALGVGIVIVGTAVIMAGLGCLGVLAVQATRRQLRKWNP